MQTKRQVLLGQLHVASVWTVCLLDKESQSKRCPNERGGGSPTDRLLMQNYVAEKERRYLFNCKTVHAT